MSVRVSIVTPTFRRPEQVADLFENLRAQTVLPCELVLVDGAPEDDTRTEAVVKANAPALPFPVVYVRSGRGTAIQRNAGIDRAAGDFVAFIDDDVRLEPNFLEVILDVFAADADRKIGGVVGYRTNQHFSAADTARWRWYRRLRLLTVYEPGRYDSASGYPINANLQPPFSGTRDVDFMTTACAVWRREVLDAGLRFDAFFADYGVLEDAHFSLRAGRTHRLVQCGDAHCKELHAAGGREDRRRIGYKCVVNYYFVFRSVFGALSWDRKLRFWRFQLFELVRIGASAVRRARWADVMEIAGRLEGFAAVALGRVRTQ